MTDKNTHNSYGSVSKWYHWISALLIIGLLIIGATMVTLTANHPIKWPLYDLHKSIALVTFAIIIARWIWRHTHPIPAPRISPALLKKAVHASHELLYVILLLMLTSGFLMTAAGHHPIHFFYLWTLSTDWFPKNIPLSHLSGRIHLILAWTITGLLVLHIVAACKHHWIDKDDTLRRMLPKKNNPTSS